MAKVLLIGESWFKYTTEIKGFDHFSMGTFEVGCEWLEKALQTNHDFDHLPSHEVHSKWPDLSQYDVVLLSDVGANTFLLSDRTFFEGVPDGNKLIELADYVRAGGGLGMVGGYLSFSGIEAKALYAGTPIEEVLPVTMARYDDRVEVPEGLNPTVADPADPLLEGISTLGPLLGYNRLVARPEADVHATVGDDPIIASWNVAAGRAFTYASDCGPHWASMEYLTSTEYSSLWNRLVSWAAGSEAERPQP